MYLIPLKALMVHALRVTFDEEYVEPDFRNLRVGIEYPVEAQQMPGIWVDYDDTAPLRQAGVAHRETDVLDVASGTLSAPHTRFRFEGTATFTIVALSSRERDRLYDELIRVLAFGAENTFTSQFRQTIEDNDLIAVNAKFDELSVGGNAASPGTPWGTDEIIYEKTISLDLLGEFVADPVAGDLVPLSAIIVEAVVDITLEDPDYVPGLPSSADGKGVWV